MYSAMIVSNAALHRFHRLVRLNPRDMRRLTKKMDIQFRRDEKRLFATKGASGGPTWDENEDLYRKWKRSKGFSTKPMQMTRDTKRALTTTGRGHIASWKLQPARVFLGTWLPAPTYHRGSGRKQKLRDTIQRTQSQEFKYFRITREYYAKVKAARIQRVFLAGLRARGLS